MMQSLDELHARLVSDDAEERRRATSDLSEFDAERAADFLIQVLGDQDWRVRKEAVLVALTYAPSRVMLTRLISALASAENVGLRNAAVEAIGGYGEDAVELLAHALSSMDADGRKLAVEALGRSGGSSSMPVLSATLEDRDPNVHLASIEALASIGCAGVREVEPLLEACLVSSEPLTKLAALEGLNAMGSRLPWSTIERCLGQPMLRHPALIAAGQSGDLRAVPVLLDALEVAFGTGLAEVTLALFNLSRFPEALAALLDSRGRTHAAEIGERLAALVLNEQQAEENRRAALIVLGVLGLPGAAECALDALGDDRLLGEAHEALELLGSYAVPALVEAARGASVALRASCLAILSRIADEHNSVPALEAARFGLFDESAEVQRAALGLLARIGDPESIEEVVRFFGRENTPATLHAAESALQELASRYPQAASELARRVEPLAPEAQAACVAIGALRGGVRGSLALDIAFLAAALSNTSAAARRAAIEVLAELSGADGVTAIAFALTDEEREVRRVAVAALGSMRGEDGSPVGVSQLVELVEQTPDPDLLAAAARALGETGDLSTLAVLKPLLRSNHPFVSVSAVEAIAKIAGPRVVDVLLEGLVHPDAEVAKAAMLALSNLGDPRVLAHIGAYLDHEAWDVRRLAADLLGRMSGDLALGLLRARLPSESSPPVRDAIARALEGAGAVRKTSAPPAGEGSGAR